MYKTETYGLSIIKKIWINWWFIARSKFWGNWWFLIFLRNSSDNHSNIRNVTEGFISCFVSKIMEFTQNSTGLSLGILVDGLPGALHWRVTRKQIGDPPWVFGPAPIYDIDKKKYWFFWNRKFKFPNVSFKFKMAYVFNWDWSDNENDDQIDDLWQDTNFM